MEKIKKSIKTWDNWNMKYEQQIIHRQIKNNETNMNKPLL